MRIEFVLILLTFAAIDSVTANNVTENINPYMITFTADVGNNLTVTHSDPERGAIPNENIGFTKYYLTMLNLSGGEFVFINLMRYDVPMASLLASNLPHNSDTLDQRKWLSGMFWIIPNVIPSKTPTVHLATEWPNNKTLCSIETNYPGSIFNQITTTLNITETESALVENLSDKLVDAGFALNKQGKYDEAIKAYDEAIRMNPMSSGAWSNRGVALVNQGNYDEAIKSFDEALLINPGDTNATLGKNVVLGSKQKVNGYPSWLRPA